VKRGGQGQGPLLTEGAPSLSAFEKENVPLLIKIHMVMRLGRFWANVCVWHIRSLITEFSESVHFQKSAMPLIRVSGFPDYIFGTRSLGIVGLPDWR
jgi:hypothetical protein